MTVEEKQKFLKDQLDLLADAAKKAYNEGYYGDLPEIMKIALTVFDMIATTQSMASTLPETSPRRKTADGNNGLPDLKGGNFYVRSQQ